MTHLFQDFDLSCNSLDILFIFDLVLLQDFDSHLELKKFLKVLQNIKTYLLSSQCVRCKLHLSESTLTQGFTCSYYMKISP